MRYILCAIFLLFPIIGFSQPVKIFLVNSYSNYEEFTAPQLYSTIRFLREKYGNIEIKSFHFGQNAYLFSETQFIQLSRSANRIALEFNPDVIIVYGDPAFEYFLVPRLNLFNEKKLLFSGIFREYEFYKNKYELLQQYPISGVETSIDMNLTLHSLDRIQYDIDNFYIFWTDNKISLYLKDKVFNQLGKEFRVHRRDLVLIKVRTVLELRRELIRLNRIKEKGLIVNSIHALFNDEVGIHWSPLRVSNELQKWNIKHIEVAFNFMFTRPDYGLAFSAGPDSILAGKILVEMLDIDHHKVEKLNSILTVNTDRLDYLKLQNFYLSNMRNIKAAHR